MNRHGTKLAVAIMVWFDGKLMLTKRRKTPYFKGWYALVGGSVEPNEYIEEAARREMQEETLVGVWAYDMHLIDCYQENDFKCFFFETHFPQYRFKDIKNPEPEKHSPWKLYTPEEVLELPKVMPAIRDILQKRQKNVDKKAS